MLAKQFGRDKCCVSTRSPKSLCFQSVSPRSLAVCAQIITPTTKCWLRPGAWRRGKKGAQQDLSEVPRTESVKLRPLECRGVCSKMWAALCLSWAERCRCATQCWQCHPSWPLGCGHLLDQKGNVGCWITSAAPLPELSTSVSAQLLEAGWG